MSRAAFAEVQKKLVDTQKQYRHMQQQQATTQREALQAKLTAEELAKVEGDTPVYKAIGAPPPPSTALLLQLLTHLGPRVAPGRMFMLAEKDKLVAECAATVKKSEERLTVMVNTQNYLERQMEECQKSLHEMALANPTGEDAEAGDDAEEENAD